MSILKWNREKHLFLIKSSVIRFFSNTIWNSLSLMMMFKYCTCWFKFGNFVHYESRFYRSKNKTFFPRKDVLFYIKAEWKSFLNNRIVSKRNEIDYHYERGIVLVWYLLTALEHVRSNRIPTVAMLIAIVKNLSSFVVLGPLPCHP